MNPGIVGRGCSPAAVRRLWRQHGLRRTFQSLARLQDRQIKDTGQSQDNQAPSRTSQISRLLKDASPADTNLLAPVHIPEDPYAILNERHPATALLASSALVVTREMEMMNVMLGYEEANKYVIMDAHGNHVGYMAEEDRGMGRMLTRQMLRTHRSFTTHIFDRQMREVLRFHRPFSYINSTIGVYDPLESSGTTPPPQSAALQNAEAGQMTPETSSLQLSDMRLIGETKQIWAPIRRKYDLYLARPAEQGDPSLIFEQFARVDEPFLSWDFALRAADGSQMGAVTRNFTNLGRELFTDAGVYALRMDSAAEESTPESRDASEVLGSSNAMTLDQRAVMLATAVTIDYDYFSRERGGFFGGMPLWIPFGGGTAGEAGAAGAGAGAAGAMGEAGAAGAAGAGSEVAGAAAGGVARGAAGGVGSIGEGAMTGAGTMAAYEAMQQARGGRAPDDASPTTQEPSSDQSPSGQQQGQEELPWWEQDQQQQQQQQQQGQGQEQEQDPWGFGNNDQGSDGGGGDSDWGDWF